MSANIIQNNDVINYIYKELFSRLISSLCLGVHYGFS